MLSQLAHSHVAQPRNRGELPGWTHYGVSGWPGDGPYVQIWLQVEDQIVIQANYETLGCPSSVAAASVLCTLAKGRRLGVIHSISEKDLLIVLGGLPEGKEQFASLAVSALNAAMSGGTEN